MSINKSIYGQLSGSPENDVSRPERILTRLPQIELSDEQIEIMAEAAHKAFCRGLTSRGFRYGPEINAARKTHPALVEYQNLPDDLKDASRANVGDIPRKLHQLGYRIETGDDQSGLFIFSDTDVNRLAQLEHQRWMEHRLETGWTLGPKTNPSRKTHASLVAWDDLSEGERDKDREMIRSIPEILAAAGFVIVAD